MITNKESSFVNSTNQINLDVYKEIDPAKLPFDLKSPPKEVVRNVIFATNLYAYKFHNCIYCSKKEEKSQCCGGKKIIARCDKLNIEQLTPPSCLFCAEYEDHRRSE